MMTERTAYSSKLNSEQAAPFPTTPVTDEIVIQSVNEVAQTPADNSHDQHENDKRFIDSMFTTMFDKFVGLCSDEKNFAPTVFKDVKYDPDTWEPKLVPVSEGPSPVEALESDIELYVRGSLSNGTLEFDPSIMINGPVSLDDYVKLYISHGVRLATERQLVQHDTDVLPEHIDLVESDPESELNRSFFDITKHMAVRVLGAVGLEFHSKNIDIVQTKK